MIIPEAEIYFNKLPKNKRARFNVLVKIALKLGKPFEGAYDYAKTILS